MPKVVQVPKVGNIQFPDEMPDDQVAQASGDAHTKALLEGVMKFMEDDPAFQEVGVSEKHKALAGIAQTLEQFPRLAQAVDAGMSQVTSSPNATVPGRQGTQAPSGQSVPQNE